MSRSWLILFLCLYLTSDIVGSARILGVFSMPSISHQVVFRALTLELGKRGHELVVLTPNPALPKDRPKDNVTEIDTSESYQAIMEMMSNLENVDKMKRGVIADLVSVSLQQFVDSMLYLTTYQFDLPEVQTFLEDKTQQFHLAIVEAICNYPLIVGKIFNVPIIQFSSFYGTSENFEIIGAPSWHPIYFPSTFSNKHGNLSFWEKIDAAYLEWKIYRMNIKLEQIENKMLQKRYGPNAPTVAELQKNIHMLFLNAHPIIAANRPVPTNVIFLGSGLHLQPLKPLPEDLKSYLDSSTRGVIYVSLGTNVRPSMMHQEFLEVFLNAFEALPYDILWKFDGDNLQNVPKNVKIQKWFPQRDLLVHPKIKAFVMQGGLQSTDEAIDAGVPLVGIPILGDQWYNVNKYEELGIGIKMNTETMSATDLINAVNEILSDNKYRENIKRLRVILQDQVQTPLEKAVWWTEYVLRHGGARHLSAPSANKTLAEYYMLDVVAVVLSGFITVVIVAVVIIAKILSKLTPKKQKSKQN